MAIRDPRAGRFRIVCPTCAAALILAVPDDPASPPQRGARSGTGTGTRTGTGCDSPARRPVVPRRADAIRPGWLGRYRVLGGDRGRVWRFGPMVALSVVRERWAADPRFTAGWTLEALAATELRHPNLSTPFGVEATENRVYAAEAIGPGASLADPSTRGDLDRQERAGRRPARRAGAPARARAGGLSPRPRPRLDPGRARWPGGGGRRGGSV